MLKRIYILLIGVLLQFSMSVGQKIDPSCWLTHLEDDLMVSSLSIPGAHEAATGEGLNLPAGLGKAQTLSITSLWEQGIRVFDLRPAIQNTSLQIYHGLAKVRISFAEALQILSDKLNNTPGEFAIVILREEQEAESTTESKLWPKAIGEQIEKLGSKAAYFRPTLKVKDLRGKILFLSRNQYMGTKKGGIIHGWSHRPEGQESATIVSMGNNTKATLRVQDFYHLNTPQKRIEKKKIVHHFLNLAAENVPGIWTINFLSGYTHGWMGTSLATTSGYKRNAEEIHKDVLLKWEQEPNVTSTGILMLDFAGVDKTIGGIWHWKPFTPYGKVIVKKIIERNFVKLPSSNSH